MHSLVLSHSLLVRAVLRGLEKNNTHNWFSTAGSSLVHSPTTELTLHSGQVVSAGTFHRFIQCIRHGGVSGGF